MPRAQARGWRRRALLAAQLVGLLTAAAHQSLHQSLHQSQERSDAVEFAIMPSPCAGEWAYATVEEAQANLGEICTLLARFQIAGLGGDGLGPGVHGRTGPPPNCWVDDDSCGPGACSDALCRRDRPTPTIVATVSAYSGPGANGPSDLVSNAIPLRQGLLQPADAGSVRVLDSGGTELSLATRVLATWGDGSIRSLLLQFLAPVAQDYTIQLGTRRTTEDRTLLPVTWDLPQRVFTLPPSYLCASLIFWEQFPIGLPGWERWDEKQVAGWRRHLATVGTAECSRDDHYYDGVTTTYQLYARSGLLEHLTTARGWALHHSRDQIYLSGEYAGWGRNCPGNTTRYTYPQGLIDDWMMWGDERVREASRLVVDNFYMPHADRWYYRAPNTRGFWTVRNSHVAHLSHVFTFSTE